ncbi:Arylsulfatase [Pontiella desulfatans]|uniref:Arylsulfatase n=1 Tax=Pontiella desulfatans TaxID=2750659 RepID=A0A6C2UA88_PONDE|nr:sulfatase-like hydrolase/transferase [Pontiella desulfatans]SPS74023.1 sulfatase S1_23 [Kiritimatiellales bacterium]VGO16296.1 Arylsulfatase [Pontiella desulfatans]
MKRRNFMKCVSAAVGAAGVASAYKLTVVGKKPPERPNIIYIISDDQGWGDVAYYGHPTLKTPELDDMAAESLRCDRFYAAASVCSPTRATVLTGRSNWRMNITSPLNPGEAAIPYSNKTLAEYLQPLNYYTAHVGKWHIGGFEQATAGAYYRPPWTCGFDHCHSTYNVVNTGDPYAALVDDYNAAQAGTPNVDKNNIVHDMDYIEDTVRHDLYWVYPPPAGKEAEALGGAWNIPIEIAKDDAFLRSGNDAATTGQKTIDFIREANRQNKPFFIYSCFHSVHTPLSEILEYKDDYADIDQTIYEACKKYFTSLTAMDFEIGRIRDELRTLGIADNTIVVFSSDNGPNKKDAPKTYVPGLQGGRFYYTHIGSPGGYRGYKRDEHEGGLRVPGIIEWPAVITTPRSTKYPVVTYDFVPAMLELLGIEPEMPMDGDGTKLLKLLRNQIAENPNGTLVNPADERKPMGFKDSKDDAWMTHTHKLVRTDWTDLPGGAYQWELYNMVNDEFEETDLSTTDPTLLNSMIADWTAWAADVQNDIDDL